MVFIFEMKVAKQFGLICYDANTLLATFFLNFSFSKFAIFFPTHFLPIYNLSVKYLGSQMRLHALWGPIWIQTVCKSLPKFTASGKRVNVASQALGQIF